MTNPALRISLIQDNPVSGDVTGNTEMVISHLQKESTADLVVFSECFITGYPVNDLVLRPGFLRSVDEAVARIRDEVIRMNGPAVLVGAPQVGAILPYNAAFLIEPNGSTRVVHKAELPNTDVFDERRTFQMSNDPNPGPLMFRGFRLGIQICEDMWHGRVSSSLADELADVLLVINGSPYQLGKHQVRLDLARTRIRSTGLPLIYLNQVGGQDELVFDGASFIMNTQGNPVVCKAFEPDIMRVLLKREKGGVHIELAAEAYDVVPAVYPEDGIEADWRACVLGLRDYINKTGAPRVFIGVSGGLDSALVLAMAVDAIGKDRVCGVMMPSPHTGQESLDLADDLMRRLDVRARVIRIDSTFQALDGVLTGCADDLAADLRISPNHGIARENYQARIRGMILMGLTNALGGIVLSTGNKSEMAVGYATLYGDMAGGYNPLKSVYKTRAFRMAEWRNLCNAADLGLLGSDNPIPSGIITRPPTAELAAGQTDQASLGEYFLLDEVLHCLIEERMDPVATARHIDRVFTPAKVSQSSGGHDGETYAAKIARLVRNAQYKRAQACPGVKLNSTDFGLGWRYPIAGKYSL